MTSWAWETKTSRRPVSDTMKKDMLAFIARFTRVHGFSPNTREIAEAIGIKSRSTVHGLIMEFERKGLLVRLLDSENRLRGLRVV